jgi:FkbM family methyltransferase
MAMKAGEKGRVIAFEPGNSAYEALRRNIGLNNLNNVKPIQVALGDQIDMGSLYNRPRIGIGATSLLRSSDSEFLQKVNISPGDYIVKDRKFPLPKAVKIDVEGFEYPVIKGLKDTLSNEICKLVCCEIHSILFPNDINCSMIIDLLKSLGFTNIITYIRGGEIHAICYKE